MTVWIVIEEDRGMGTSVSGVYLSEDEAKAACSGNEWVDGPHEVHGGQK